MSYEKVMAAIRKELKELEEEERKLRTQKGQLLTRRK
tara:strand:- start:321 stop:431 length:111 start_codon:yes stop_codon:yes gene_type:complete